MIINVKIMCAATLGMMLVACGSKETEMAESKSDTLSVNTETTKVDEAKDFKLHLIIANIPSPSHEIVVIKKANYSYEPSFMLDKAKAGSFPTEFKKGITYGMYSADLAYVASFNKNNDLLSTFAATRKAAESANVGKIFDDITKAGHFEEMQNNPDSLEAILERAYVASEGYFESDHHIDIAARVLIGAWVEGQYLLLSTLNTQKSAQEKELKNKVWESKLHLININELLTEYTNDPDFSALATSLKQYYINYDGVSGIDNFSKEKIKKMLGEITAIRSKLVE